VHLHSLVDGLAARPEVTGVAVISGEGLLIDQALGPTTDGEALAALATTLIRHANELGGAAAQGPLGTAVLEFGAGPVIVTGLADGAALVLQARPEVDLGELLYLVRRHRGAIADLL
jgi:predicted regulator of Ras-like GTPase activity (Roadblock/LC7/MglB family)